MLQTKIDAHFQKEYPSTFENGFHDKVSIKRGKIYWRIDVGSSGKFMLDTESGDLFFIKGYGTIDRKKSFGSLADIVQKDFDYDGYSIVPKGGRGSRYGYGGRI